MELGLFFFLAVLGEAAALEEDSLGGLVVCSHTWKGRGLAARRYGSSEGRGRRVEGGDEVRELQ